MRVHGRLNIGLVRVTKKKVKKKVTAQNLITSRTLFTTIQSYNRRVISFGGLENIIFYLGMLYVFRAMAVGIQGEIRAHIGVAVSTKKISQIFIQRHLKTLTRFLVFG